MNIEAPYACDPEKSRGRFYNENHRVARGPRNLYQRDRDRIIHSISFRRLRHKTQVFVLPDGDHTRVRLTHSLEVAQIGRTIARALGLNEDLTEALCLAHDIGHPPFGHAGEDALEDAMNSYGGFDHNAHTLRTLTKLDSPYPLWPGLNLSWELLEGLAKHNGPVTEPNWALQEIDATHNLELTQWASLEAQVAAVADDIAYDNHDIDDGIRAGLLTMDQMCELPFIETLWTGIQCDYPHVAQHTLQAELIRSQIGIMVNDVIETTKLRIASLGIKNTVDVRLAGQMIAGFSNEMAKQERSLKEFMYANLYHHPMQIAAAQYARVIVADLYAAYAHDNSLLPKEWQAELPEDALGRHRHIADFLAGMTDRYAEKQHKAICG